MARSDMGSLLAQAWSNILFDHQMGAMKRTRKGLKSEIFIGSTIKVYFVEDASVLIEAGNRRSFVEGVTESAKWALSNYYPAFKEAFKNLYYI